VNYSGFIGEGWELNVVRRVHVVTKDGNDQPSTFWLMEGNGKPSGLYTKMTGQTNWYSQSQRGDQYEYVAATSTEPQLLIHYLLDGSVETFSRLDAVEDYYYLTGSADIFGNAISYTYSDQVANTPLEWTLTTVTDDLGRDFEFTYDANHGRLIGVQAKAGSTVLAEVDYTYQVLAGGHILLDTVTTGEIPTEDPVNGLTMVRKVETYVYEEEDSAAVAYDGWRLAAIKNGNNEEVVYWEYGTGTDEGKVKKQIDRRGSTKRTEGVHTYSYSSSQTTYTGPDGETREFLLDTYGRITGRVEHPDAQSSLTTSFEYAPGCNTCSRVSKVTYPDGSYQRFDYDTLGNLIVQWWYPETGSTLPPRVERWRWSSYDPVNGDFRVRLLEHELRRDADPQEDPDHPCQHPSCSVLDNAEGHLVHFYTWTNEKTLDSIDYGSIQNSADSPSTSLDRFATFTYFSDGRLKESKEFEDTTLVGKRTYTLDSTSAYIASEVIHDSLNSTSWTTTYVHEADTYFPSTETAPDSTVTKYHFANSGMLYRVEENLVGVNAQRTTELRYDAAGNLVSTEISASDGSSDNTEFKLDESGQPYEIETKTQGGPARITKIELSPGGLFEAIEDWRGWRTETTYGVGSLQLPTEVKEIDANSNSRLVWRAGDGGTDSGYDNMGRLTSSRNVAGWKSYLSYNDRGDLKYAFTQTDSTHYAAEGYFYDVRGFLREKEVGSLDGDPLSFTLQDLTWLQHIVYVHNLSGHLLSRAVYESGNQDEARLVRYETDGRGRPIKSKVYQGDRTGTPTAVVEEIAYDALNRPISVWTMESASSSVPVHLIELDYDDALREIERTVIQGIGGPKSKMVTKIDALGRLQSRTQTAWSGGAWGTTRAWTYEFDGLDNPTATTESTGIRKEWDGNDLGQLTHEKLYKNDGTAPLTTTYAYDATTGALTSVTDADGSVTSYEVYSEWNHPKKVTHPDGRIFEFKEYDVLGRRTKTLDGRGVEHNYVYDYGYLEEDNVTKPTLPVVPGPDSMTWVYDRDNFTVTHSRVWENGTKIWETEFTHNDLGEKLWEEQGLAVNPPKWEWTYGFAGELLEVNYPSGLGIDAGSFSYDTSGRVDQIQYKKGTTILSDEAIGYDGLRGKDRVDSVSGLTAAFRYDQFSRLDRLEWSKDVSGTLTILEGQERVFDLGDRVTSRQRLLDTTGDVFVHDAYGRMEYWYQGVPNANTATLPLSTWTESEQYALNAVYERDKVTAKEMDNGVVTTTIRDYTADDSHFYTIVDGTPRLKQDGRLSVDGNHTYGWDAWGRLAEVATNGNLTVIREHLYDAEGRRVETKEIDQGTTTTYRMLYWGARLAAIYEDTSTPTNVRTYGYAGGADSETFVEITAAGSINGSYAIARDAQGSFLALIDRTSKSVVERYRYSVFGEVAIEDGSGTGLTASAYLNDRFFLGKPFDAVVGIYDLRARGYNPATGAFLTPDPLGPVDSWNLYQYGFATAGTWMDPFGLQSGGLNGSGVRETVNPNAGGSTYQGAGDTWLDMLGGQIKKGLDGTLETGLRTAGALGSAAVDNPLLFVWESPQNLIGAGLTLAGGVLRGAGGILIPGAESPEFELEDGGLSFNNNPLSRFFGAIALGVYRNFGTKAHARHPHGDPHEGAHRPQSKVLGPLYLPAHVISLLLSGGISASKCEFHGGMFHAYNLLERGPSDVGNERPWFWIK